MNRAYAEQGRLRSARVGRLVARRGDARGARADREPHRRDRREQAGVIPGVLLLPLRVFADERGWFSEIRRESLLPHPTVQTNVSFSRKGVIRGLHYHERGQDDLFACLTGMARVVVLDRESGETFTVDIGEENPVAVYVPGHHAHGFEALTDLLFCYHVTREYDPADPDEHGIPWDDPRVRHLWSTDTPDPLGAGRVLLITGAGGQLGAALREAFPDCRRAHARRARRDGAGRARLRAGARPPRRRLDGRGRGRGRRGGGARGSTSRGRGTSPPSARPSSTTPPTTSSTARSASRTSSPTSRRRSAPTGARSSSASARCGRAGSSGARGSSAGPGTTSCGRCCASAPSGDEVQRRRRPARLPHVRRPSGGGDPRAARRFPAASGTSPADGECTWAEFAAAIFEEAGLDCRVVPISHRGARPRRRRDRRTRCSAASARAPRGSRTGARACAVPGAARRW